MYIAGHEHEVSNYRGLHNSVNTHFFFVSVSTPQCDICHNFSVESMHPIIIMPAEMSVDLKRRIIDWYLVDQYTYCQIAGLADCSIGHVSNVMRNFREFGQVKNPFSSRTGRPSQIEEGDIMYLHALLEANPALYLDELQTRLLSVQNINLSIATISRILAQYELMRKRLHKVAAERDEELRGIWEADMAQYQDPDVFVALDESAVDVKTLQRHFGRSLAGTPCVQRAAFLRGTRY
jgi:transposase